MIDKWDRRMMRLAREIASWSKDPSSKFGVVVARRPLVRGVWGPARVVGTGFNGFPPGVDDDERLHDRAEKLELVVHAEVNGVLHAGREAMGAHLYMYGARSAPCRNCTKHVVAAGIARVVGCGPPIPDRWKASVEASETTLAEAGVEIAFVELDDLERP